MRFPYLEPCLEPCRTSIPLRDTLRSEREYRIVAAVPVWQVTRLMHEDAKLRHGVDKKNAESLWSGLNRQLYGCHTGLKKDSCARSP